MSRHEAHGAREEFQSALGGASTQGGGANKFGTLTGMVSEGLGATNNTGAFLSAGMPFTTPVGMTDFILHYHLFISSAAGATGGINLQIATTGGGVRIFTALGNSGSRTAFVSQTGFSSAVGPFCTFDCSALLGGFIGPGVIDVEAIIVGANVAGLVFDLQFQNAVGVESWTVDAVSYAVAIKINK
jgi:hypothetical protein